MRQEPSRKPLTEDESCKEIKRCGAQLRKKPGQFCRKPPIKGKRRCKLHGGKSLAGIASGRYKHGRYSRYLPMDLRKQYEESKDDPEFLSHQPDLRLMDLHLQQLLVALNKPENMETFVKAREAFEEFKRFQREKNAAAMKHALDKLDLLFTVGVQSGSVWNEVREVIEQRRKILESETKRIHQSSNSMSGEQILALIEYIVDVLRSSVSKYADRLIASKILQQVTTDIGVVVSRPDQASASTARLLA